MQNKRNSRAEKPVSDMIAYKNLLNLNIIIIWKKKSNKMVGREIVDSCQNIVSLNVKLKAWKICCLLFMAMYECRRFTIT